MLENSPARFDVNFAGPKDSDVDEDSLKDVKVFTFPGGPGKLPLRRRNTSL
ncbi:uncharacterized protein CC84DRAFT_1168725, partial [Paraphaeosphaeria sporulosa]